jgi:hypothetical protein
MRKFFMVLGAILLGFGWGMLYEDLMQACDDQPPGAKISGIILTKNCP